MRFPQVVAFLTLHNTPSIQHFNEDFVFQISQQKLKKPLEEQRERDPLRGRTHVQQSKPPQQNIIMDN